jgi:hypothetical protein
LGVLSYPHYEDEQVVTGIKS